MPYAHVNGAQLYYEQHGRGPDLVFLHGAGGNHLSWWQQITSFSGGLSLHGVRCPRLGLSKGDTTIGRFVLGTDLVALLDHLKIERAHVVAQSMGGRSVAGLVRLAPHKAASIILCGTTAGATNDRIRELQHELKDVRGDVSLREYALADEFEAANPAMATLYRQVNALNPSRPKGFLGRPPATYRGSMHGPIGASGAPVQFIVGEHDLITSPEMIREAQSLIPGSLLHEVKGAGHSAYFEKADEWNGVVRRFIESVSVARA